MEFENNDKDIAENGEIRNEEEKPPEEKKDSSEVYGAVYSSSGTGSGEYSYRPYSAVHTEPAENPKKKKSSAGMVIGITVSVVLCVLAIAGIAYGIVSFGRAFLGEIGSLAGNREGTSETSERAEPDETAPLPDHSGDVVHFAGGEGVSTVTVQSGEEMAVVDVVAAVKDSVVEIRTESVIGGTGRFKQYIVSGAGSGVVISEGGLIITNHHVIDGATKITVTFTDGTTAEATLIGTDEEADIAVISVAAAGKELKPATLGDSDKLLLGQTVLAIGNPLGELGGSVSRGIISSTAREISVDSTSKMTLIQTDAAINPGNSGGALFNLRGELIGIVNAKSSGDSIEGLGFAIPINTAWSVADNLIKYGYVPGRVILSLKGVKLEDNYGDYMLSYGNCIVVTEADDDSAFKVGDVITSVGSVSVSSVSELQKALRAYNVGDTVKIKVTRQYNEGFFSYTRSGYVDAVVTGTENGAQ